MNYKFLFIILLAILITLILTKLPDYIITIKPVSHNYKNNNIKEDNLSNHDKNVIKSDNENNSEKLIEEKDENSDHIAVLSCHSSYKTLNLPGIESFYASVSQ